MRVAFQAGAHGGSENAEHEDCGPGRITGVDNRRLGKVTNTARVKVDQCQVIATGRRVAPTSGDFPDAGPNMAIGVDFDGRSSGAVFRTEASGNVGAGIRDRSSGTVTIKDVYLFNNNPNLQGITPED
jgi:hypothetical protein